MDNKINRAVPVDQQYDAFVDKAAELKDTTTLQNDSTSCALSVFRSMAKHAESSLDIFSGALDPQVFDDVLLEQNILEFLKKDNAKLRILIQDRKKFETFSPSPLILRHLDGKANVEIAFLPLTSAGTDLSHFTVVDSSSYRLEVKAAEHQALVNFSDAEFSVRLSKCYEALWAQSVPLKKTSSNPATEVVGEPAVGCSN